MADTAPAPGGGGKILGLKPRTAMIAGGVILAAAIGYMLWKRKKAAATPAVTSASASSSTGIDYGGELSVIQSELEDLLAAEGQESSGTGTGSSATGTGTSGTGSSSTGTTTATKTPAKTAAPAVPAGVHATKVTASSVTLAWNKAANATSYRVRVTYQGKLVSSASSNGTSVTVSGLGADHTYTFHVASVGPGGTSAETNGPAVKTSR